MTKIQLLVRLTQLGALVMIIIGFRFASQAGLAGLDGTIQNDGYAIGGGALIVAGSLYLGACLGYMFARQNPESNVKK